MSKIIYHYTDANGLKGIFENRVLWATDIRYLNDSKEYQYGLEIFSDLLRGKDEFKNYTLDAVTKYSLNESLDNKYVICFSEESNSLTQYTTYAENAYGYCVGFDLEKLNEILNSQFPDNFIARELNYSLEEIKLHIDSAINEFIEYEKLNLENLSESVKPAISRIEREQDESQSEFENRKSSLEEITKKSAGTSISMFAQRKLMRQLVFCKHPGFKQEKEFRILIYNQIENQVEHRLRRGVFVPYVKVELGDSINDLIKEVYLGPNLDINSASVGLSSFFRTKGFFDGPGIIKPSGIPYKT
jgi:Protein of unknown function (DUF2971)